MKVVLTSWIPLKRSWGSQGSARHTLRTATVQTITMMFWFLSQSTLPRWHSSKESACQFRRCRKLRFNPWIGNIPWSRKWQTTPVFLPGKFHGQRSLTGYSPWVAKSQTRLSPHTHIHKKPITLITSGKGDRTTAGSREDRSGRHVTICHFVSSFR